MSCVNATASLLSDNESVSRTSGTISPRGVAAARGTSAGTGFVWLAWLGCFEYNELMRPLETVGLPRRDDGTAACQ
jgi:hypothetical protein